MWIANLNKPLFPPYYKEVLDNKNTDPICIKRATSLVNWNDVFRNKTAVEKVKSPNNILLNIFRKCIPHNIIKFDYLSNSKYPN